MAGDLWRRCRAGGLLVSIVLFIGVGATGCVTPPAQPVELPYLAAEYDPYRGAGDAVVYGQAFLRQQGGGVVVCAGEPVFLFPKTTSFEKVIAVAKSGIMPSLSDAMDPRFKEVVRMATCDAQGNFRFAGVPRKSWYLFSRVRWSVGDYGQQGGDLITEVDLSSGGERQVLLTDGNRL